MPGSAAAMAMQQAATSASGNWKLDAEDGGGAGLALNSHSRVLLMAKLGESAGPYYSFYRIFDEKLLELIYLLQKKGNTRTLLVNY